MNESTTDLKTSIRRCAYVFLAVLFTTSLMIWPCSPPWNDGDCDAFNLSAVAGLAITALSQVRRVIGFGSSCNHPLLAQRPSIQCSMQIPASLQTQCGGRAPGIGGHRRDDMIPEAEATDIEGEVIPGAAPVKHKLEGQPFVHPDSVGANRKHTLKVMAYDGSNGKQLWERTAYEGKVFDDIHRFNTYASSTPATDGKSSASRSPTKCRARPA